MLINSVILVLREVLEAAILISILLSLSLNRGLNFRWLWRTSALAIIGIYLYASWIEEITDALDGAGQEVVNASLQLVVYLLILMIVSLRTNDKKMNPKSTSYFSCLLVLCVAFALIREGSEIWIYISGFSAVEDTRAAIFTGSVIGTSIGISLGILLFVGLRATSENNCYRSCLILLALIGSGMVMQASILLQQVDWLPAGQALWDSSMLLSEQSITGELLYAVLGYESTPSLLQLLLYCFSLSGVLLAWYLANRYPRSDNVEQ